MEGAIFGFVGALLGAVLGFIGSVLSTVGKSKDTSKDILTRTVTNNERAQWRKDLRDLAGEFIENALRVSKNDKGGSIYALQKQQALIAFRLNPDPGHELDANILEGVRRIASCASANDSANLQSLLQSFEKNVQALLKQEWEKSKREAKTGQLDPNAKSA
jgi:hypothetical protein